MNLIKKWWFWVIIFFALFVIVFFSQKDYVPKGEIVTVGSNTVDCIGPWPMKCLIINGERSYESINGFEYEEGYSYTLDVNITRIEDPPADGSSLRYDLIKVISKTKE